jgi:hypothetical protein
VPLNPPRRRGEGLHLKRMAEQPCCLILQERRAGGRGEKNNLASRRIRTRIFGVGSGCDSHYGHGEVDILVIAPSFKKC